MHITTSEKEHVQEIPGQDLPPPTPTSGKSIQTAIILLCGCMALLMTGVGIIIPVFPQRLRAMGLGVETLALMEGAFGLGMFLFSTPMGALADRIGRRPIVLFSLATFVLTNLALAFANHPVEFIVVRFLEGALAAGLMPASTAIIGDTIPPEKQGRWIGFLTTSNSIGIVLGPGIGGFLYQAWGFSSPFFISAGCALVATVLVLLMLPETLPAQVRERARLRRSKTQAGEKSTKGPGTAQLLWLFAPVLLIDFLLTFCYPFVLPQYPFFFENTLHYNSASYGIIVSMYGLATAVFPVLLGRLSDIWPRKLLIIVGSLLSPILNVALLVLPNFPSLIIATLITGAGSALLMPAMGTLYLARTTDENRSQVMGVRSTAFSLGVLIGPLAQAGLGPFISSQAAFGIAVTVSLVATLIAVFALKNPTPQAAPEALPEVIAAD
jgi:DHA1 family multidrug resistance protein-like MFS transporter